MVRGSVSAFHLRAALGLALGLWALAPAAAGAYTAESLDRYRAAERLQAAGQWAAAARGYLSALKADPSLKAVYKDLGTVYYRAGDRKGALYYYAKYLEAHPGDRAVRSFMEGLESHPARGAGASSPGREAGAAGSARPGQGPFLPGFDARVPFTEVLAGPPQAGNPSLPGMTPSWGLGVGLDYGLAGGFVVGVDVLFGPNRSYAWNTSQTGPTGTQNDAVSESISQFAVLATPGWRFRLGKSVVLEPRLGLGIMNATVATGYSYTATYYGAAESGSSPPQSASGAGFAVWPELRGEYLLGPWGLGLSLGYLLSSASVADGGGSSSSTAYATDGLSVSVFGVYHFTPLF